MKALLILLLVGQTFFLATTLGQIPDKHSWKAAAAKSKITPDTLMWMSGYASRTKPAEGTALELLAKVAVLEDASGKRVALITLDLIAVPRTLRLSLVEKLTAAHGLGAADVFINASHTHCGPGLHAPQKEATYLPVSHADEAAHYTQQVENKLVALVKQCMESLRPASLHHSHARCGFAMNRRTPNGKGGWSNHPWPAGPVDQEVPVLRITDAGKQDIAILFGYACHATTLSFQQYCGDYPGFAQEAVETAHPTAVAMFINGCSGDQNPYPRGKLEQAQTHGRSLAMAVEAALMTQMMPLTGAIRTAHEEIALAYGTTPTAEELATRQPTTKGAESAYAGRLLGILRERGSLPKDYPYPVQVIRLGDQLTLVALGGEVVVDYSLRLKKELQDPAVWVAGYSNDVMNYIPSLRILKEGGYEGGTSNYYGTHPAPWREDLEEHIISTVHRLRSRLK